MEAVTIGMASAFVVTIVMLLFVFVIVCGAKCICWCIGKVDDLAWKYGWTDTMQTVVHVAIVATGVFVAMSAVFTLGALVKGV